MQLTHVSQGWICIECCQKLVILFQHVYVFKQDIYPTAIEPQ